MADLQLVTYCGLYCGLCAQKNRIPKRAGALKDAMQKEGYEHWGEFVPGFKEFWPFLGRLAESESTGTCRDGKCGPPFCGIRKCAHKRGVEVCSFCEDWPCEKVQGIAKGYPTLLADGKRMREIGIDAWIKEQEERAKTGFSYVDIRSYPYEVPEE